MEQGLHEGGDCNHGTVENNEGNLTLHDGIAPATGHLYDTVDAPDEDGGECDSETQREETEFGAPEENGCFG